MDFSWLVAIGLFIAAALDILFALYTLAVVKKRAFAAANLSLLTYVLGAVGIVHYITNK